MISVHAEAARNIKIAAEEMHSLLGCCKGYSKNI
jgi:hypothetical protein